MARIAWNKGITKYKPKACLCGCGEFVAVHKYSKENKNWFSYSVNDFIRSHAKRGIGGFDLKVHIQRLCACGCGLLTKRFRGHFNSFIKGHENIGRVAWNKERQFQEATRRKMSLARLGKEPANKIFVDLVELRKLYIQEHKTISMVSRELNISSDAIKNRLRTLGWSRSTKESCSSPLFREHMRGVRIRALTSQKVIKSPNKLERLVYQFIDDIGIQYKKQVPLFGKFVVDAFFPQNHLVLEIFGRYWHEKPEIKKKDFSKKKYLQKCGYHVEEIWDNEIKEIGVSAILMQVFRKHNMI